MLNTKNDVIEFMKTQEKILWSATNYTDLGFRHTKTATESWTLFLNRYP